jgi:hypothetical protein
VAAAVHAELVVADVALHQALEVLDRVLADDEVGYFLGLEVLLREPGVEVTNKAARVGIELVDHIVVVGRINGSEVGGEGGVAEGAAVDAATTGTSREVDVLQAKVGVGSAGDVLAVAAHGVFVTVEDLALLRSLGVNGPVPVGKGASVATAVLQVRLELEDEVPVPGEEVGGVVDLEGVLDVGGDVFVVSGLHTSVGTAVSRKILVSRRHVLKASDGVGELLAHLLGHGTELSADGGVLVSAATLKVAGLHALVGNGGNLLEGGAGLELLDGEVRHLGNVGGRGDHAGARARAGSSRAGAGGNGTAGSG